MINVPYEDMPREIEALLGEIEQLEQENEELKLDRKYLLDLQKNMDKQYEELEVQLNNASKNYTKYIQERDNVLDEIREYITTNTCWDLRTSKVLQILDKVKQ